MPAGRILVVLPTLGDRLETLAETLESIDAQRHDVELTLVVVAPGSAVAARELAAKFDAVLVDDPKTGISEAINRGIAARSDEEYYAWIGDDDLFRPGGLRQLRELIDATPRAVIAFGGCDYIDPEGRTIAVSNAGPLARFLLPWGPDLIPHPGSLIRLDDLEAIGAFDPSLRFVMDLDAFLKLRARGKFAWTRRSVSAFRWHPDSLTVSDRAASSAEAEAVKRRHTSAAIRWLSPLWLVPVRWASGVAAQRLNDRARTLR